MLDIGYSLSLRFPDPPQTDYRTADVRALRHDLFCGDIHLADTGEGPELSTAWGWLPVLDFAWALCDIAERLSPEGESGSEAGPGSGSGPGPGPGGAAQPLRAELDFTETTDCLLFERTPQGRVEITADWQYADDPPLTVPYAVLRREARDFLHDLVADLTDMHEELADNPVLWQLLSRFPRV